MPVSQDTSSLALITSLGPNKLVIVRATIAEQLGRLFSMEMELSSEDPALDFSAIVGGNATIRLELDHNKTRYWNGNVSRFVQTEADSKAGGRYRATLVPWLWFLTRASDCRIFQNKTVPDIIKQVFRDHGFADFKDSLTGHYGPWENCVQYRETDFNFVSRLMEHEGIYYYFTHENGKHILVLADGVSAHEPYPGYSEVTFRTGRGGVATNEAITGWALEQEVQPGTYSLNDFNFEKPKTSLVAKSKVATKHAQNSFEMYDYPGEYGEHSEGTDYSKIRIEELHSQHEIVQGEANARGIAVGYTFTLTNSPRRDQNRKYLITAASYQLTGQHYGSGEEKSGELYACHFTAIDATKHFRAGRITPKPLIQGPQTAIVVGPKGEEIHTDKHGRIVVQFHWDRHGKADENSSCWVRISQSAWAGKKWGSMFIPRVGQEVIVEFLEGDPDLPIVTGQVYNADTTPPYDLPADKTKTSLKTNSTKGGQGFNELRFEDLKGKEQVFIHSEKRMDVRVKASKYETIGGDHHVNVGAKTDKNPGGNLNITVGLDENIHVKGGLFERVEKMLQQGVTGDVIEGYDADLSTIIKAKCELNAREITLEALTKITLKVGSSFVIVDLTGVSIGGPMVKINSGGSATGTSDKQLQDPLEADTADTGQPGFFNQHGAGGPPAGHHTRLLSAQHGPQVRLSPDGKSYLVGKNIQVTSSDKDPEFASKTLGNLAVLGTTPTGSALVTKLDNGTHTVNITRLDDVATAQRNGALAGPDDAAGSIDPTKGSNTTISYNPDVPQQLYDQNGTAHDYPSSAMLGHEMIHASHNADGLNERNLLDPAEPGSNQEESRTIGINDHANEPISENNIFKDLGTGYQRTDHDRSIISH